MFGMGFMEILIIAIIAIIALGPDKLPDAMVQIAKFIRKFKTGLEDAKSTLDNELNVSEMKAEANKFKSQIEETKASLSIESKIDLGLNDILKDDLTNDSSKNETNEKIEKVSFKKEKLEKKEENA
ncbi:MULTISPECIES: Sec-independent protein translocase protein TatB [Arcobacter]|uniref:Sec-independent protein translocase protein TatB homolog n=1 Tax=Arcobacter ellisii TaxID=913109 RepID=A0A347U8M5_9BACT|nr:MULTISPECIES: Sec-independent protein translocase protein TatB [Arcobacter]AXX95203.1 twin arginine translocation system, TatB protein [Arcobacter ellisii]MBD3830199.1 Sec-independent protein translocase subunit TatB [Arcobacter sp.]MDY3204209.1 Sec-independent protein translocase protein TatB [Arcobacter sp.]RXI30147.1 twin-arginine translocase subunit TatB [Arcobacter ellisii]